MAIAILVLSSCDDDIDILPVENNTTAQFYQNEREVNQAVIGAYARFGKNGGNTDFPTDYYWLASENRSDILYLGGGETSAQNDQLDFRKFLTTPTSSTVNRIFSRLYQVIKEANNVLANTTEGEYMRYRAEASFLRGYAYFELVRTFGPVAIVDKPIEKQEALSLPRDPIEDVYNQIISDLEYASSNLEPFYTGDQSGRIGNIAVKSLLGRVYLKMASYPLNDAQAANKAISTLAPILNDVQARFATNYKDVFKLENENLYDIFSIQFTSGNNGGGSSYPGFITNGSSGGTPFPDWAYVNYTQQGQDLRVDTLLINKMVEENDTLRLNASIDRGYWNSTDEATRVWVSRDIVTKFLIKDNTNSLIKAWNDYPLNFPIIRPAGVFLDYAEASIIAGNSSDAKTYIDKVRNRAGIGSLTSVPTMQDLENERKREFIGEGKRFFDLVRLGETEAINTLTNFNSYYHSNTNTNTPTSRDLLLPIPQEEMNVRDNWTQNFGY